MLALLKALLLLPVVVVIVLFAIANRAPVIVSFDPFARGAPELAFAVPLYAIVLGACAAGVLLGGIGAWLSGGRQRRAGRQAKREARKLRGETDRLRSDLGAVRASASGPAGPGLPAPASGR
jgi:uncharacterized integral membrane protein